MGETEDRRQRLRIAETRREGHGHAERTQTLRKKRPKQPKRDLFQETGKTSETASRRGKIPKKNDLTTHVRRSDIAITSRQGKDKSNAVKSHTKKARMGRSGVKREKGWGDKGPSAGKIKAGGREKKQKEEEVDRAKQHFPRRAVKQDVWNTALNTCVLQAGK